MSLVKKIINKIPGNWRLLGGTALIVFISVSVWKNQDKIIHFLQGMYDFTTTVLIILLILLLIGLIAKFFLERKLYQYIYQLKGLGKTPDNMQNDTTNPVGKEGITKEEFIHLNDDFFLDIEKMVDRKLTESNRIILDEIKRMIDDKFLSISDTRSHNYQESQRNIYPLGKEEESPGQNIITEYVNPDERGFFRYGTGESLNDGRKFFKIVYKKGEYTADIYFIPSDRDSKVINRYDHYLKPLCEVENYDKLLTSKQIEFLESGKVNLVDDYWMIDPANKIKIKFL